MTWPPQLVGIQAVRRAALADARGQVLQASGDQGWRPELDTSAAAVALAELLVAGQALGLSGLHLLVVKAASRTTAAAVRAGELLLAEVVPGQRAGDVEQALAAWASSPAAPPPAAPEAAAAARASAGDPWLALRRALSRGHLSEAAAALRAAAEAPAGAAARPEAAIPDPAAFRDASRRLLEGVGTVLSGDTAGGARTLLEVAAPGEPNLSLRWLAACWCARAALMGGSAEVARRHVKDALDLSRRLDVEARAASQLVAAELLLRAGELDKALAWVAEARSRFERAGDAWGQARAWLVEARVRAAGGADEACLAAAQRAEALEPGWDGPHTFLAGRALAQGDLAGAERLVSGVEGAAARRVRKLVESVRQGDVRLADGAEFLRLHLAPPTSAALRSLERIADAAPRFLAAREALGWMLVKLGRYEAARGLFAWLGGQPLDAEDRALVDMGLRCVDAALLAGNQAGPAGAGGGAAARAPATGGAGVGAVFSGRLSVFSLPDLIEFLRTARRSGLLVCSSPAGVGAMRFTQGFVVGASAPGAPGVAELLRHAGQLPNEAEPIAAGGAEPEVALAASGLVAPDDLAAAVHRQVALAVREMMAWPDGEFAFNQEPPGATAPASPALVDAQALLLTLFKEQDEAARGPSGQERA